LAGDIDSYMRELRAAFGDADPALVQDALFDAEEHLNAELDAMREGRKDQDREIADSEVAAVIGRYGSPQEVAAAYLASEEAVLASALVSSTAPETSEESAVTEAEVRETGLRGRSGLWPRFFGVVADPRTYSSLLYMLLALLTGTVFFTIVVTGLSLTFGLIILIVGIPLALGFLAVVRALSLAEGRIVEALLGTRMPRRLRGEPRAIGFWGRIRFWLKDARTWSTMLYMILLLPLGTFYFTLSVCGLAVGLWMIVAPFVQVASGHTYIDYPGAEFLFPGWSLPLSVIVGALVVVLMLHLIRLLGRAHGRFAKAMLVRID
jgi:Putative sensor/HAAS